MQQPTYILDNGTRIRTHATLGTTEGMNVAAIHIDQRQANADGEIVGVVGGCGGDVYWVMHEGCGPCAPYCFDEFEPLRAWYNGSQTVIAFSPLDASRVYAEHIGEAHDDARHPWREWTGTISFYDTETDMVEGTVAEMIAEYGRGFLCSEDR